MRQESGISNNLLQAFIVLILAVAVGVIMFMKHQDKTGTPVILPKPGSAVVEDSVRSGNHLSVGVRPDGHREKPLPLLLDLGATKCIPCKMMAPILNELREEYRGRFDVVFIDVWENRKAIGQYNVRVIPTQIFFDAEGNELFRHQGFYSKDEILRKWKALGIDFSKEPDRRG